MSDEAVRKAIEEYKMIEENDKIAIGISGGKDSLCLLYALSGLRNFYPKKLDKYIKKRKNLKS